MDHTLRLELFFKSHTQLTGHVIPWLKKHHKLTNCINITNKVLVCRFQAIMHLTACAQSLSGQG